MSYKYKRNFKVPVNQLFKIITERSLAEMGIEKSKQLVGKQVTKKILDLKKEIKTTVRIESYEPNKLYSFVTIIKPDEYLTTYEFVKKDAYNTLLIYSENLKTEGKLRQWNYIVMELLFRYRFRKKTKKLFNNIELLLNQ